MRWKPKNESLGYYIDVTGRVDYGKFHDMDALDVAIVNFGNCFRTKKEAQQAAKLVKKTLMEYHRRKG